jgi:ATP-dependent protease ClpP protease subunit
MIHDGSLSISNGVEASSLIAIGKEVGSVRHVLHSILSDRSGLTVAKIEALCAKETYLGATDAVHYGFADGVLDYKKKAT